MKNLFFILTILFGLSLFSCEDKIEVPLDESDVLIVVDAFVNTKAEPQKLRITKTQQYFDNGDPAGVDDAVVSITTENEIINFEHTGNGYYESLNQSTSLGNYQDEATLNITADGKDISSTVSIGRSPLIDEIRQQEGNDLFRDSIYVEVIARDFIGLGDTYWIKSFRNGEFLNLPEELNIAYDATFDTGAETDGFIFIPPIRELINPLDTIGWNVGDVVKVEIHSLHPEIFTFMETMRDQMINGNNGIFAEPLANATGNIENLSSDERILGAFCVSEITSLEKVIE